MCVAFETMNNRGKPLTCLGLLKNRLIYLSLKLSSPESEKRKLRSAINDCWKSIYHNLGRNKDKPLDDDQFLLNHYLTYFGERFLDESGEIDHTVIVRASRLDYSSVLLEQTFITKNIQPDAPAENRIALQDLYNYVSSLQDSVQLWYKIFNPFESDFNLDVQIWLDKLTRIGLGQFLPLVLTFIQREVSDAKRVQFLRALERHAFLLSLLERHYYFNGLQISPRLIESALRMTRRDLTPDKLIRELQESSNEMVKNPDFIRTVQNRFKSDGFYAWGGVRYFLYEYNLSLQEKSKTDRPKIFWSEFTESRDDFVSVEHIFPQKARHAYWTSRFCTLSTKQKSALRNSLGNLLPLSRPKNSSLSNRPYPEKSDGREDGSVGYRFGCYAENEVSKCTEWTPKTIAERGVKLIRFMEKRWDIQFGSDIQLKKMLGVEFVK